MNFFSAKKIHFNQAVQVGYKRSGGLKKRKTSGCGSFSRDIGGCSSSVVFHTIPDYWFLFKDWI